jgi:hypothetical protein
MRLLFAFLPAVTLCSLFDGLLTEVTETFIGIERSLEETKNDFLTLDDIEMAETPCMEYVPGMEFDEEDDERDLQEKSRLPRQCESWCVHWEFDWWEKCAWEKCNGCAACNEQEFCRPLNLISEDGCKEIFRPLDFLTKNAFDAKEANKKYNELCQKNGTSTIGFLTQNGGPCGTTTKSCPCRANDFCTDWTVKDKIGAKGGDIMMSGSCPTKPGAECCEAKSCVQTFVRTEAVAATAGAKFCFLFSAKAGADWYDVAGGLFTENKLGTKKAAGNDTATTDDPESGNDAPAGGGNGNATSSEKVRNLAEHEGNPAFGFPQEFFMYRGDATPGLVGKSMEVQMDGDHFIGFFGGSYDRTGGGGLGALLSVSGFAWGQPPPPCSDPKVGNGDYCSVSKGELPANYDGSKPNCCADHYIMQKNKCSRGPKVAPCNIKKTVAQMREQIKDLHEKMDEMLVENEKTEKIIIEAKTLKTAKIDQEIIDSWKKDMNGNAEEDANQSLEI